MLAIMPLLILFIGAFATMLLSRLSSNRGLTGSVIASATIVASLSAVYSVSKFLGTNQVALYPGRILNYAAFINFDHLTVLISTTALLLGLMVAVFSYRYMEHDLSMDKFYSLLLIMLGGIVGLASSGDLFTLWVFFELMCISSYILVSFRKERWEPLEAGFKYLVMSAAGSMLVLLGIAIVFGTVGYLDLFAIKAMVTRAPSFALTAAAVLFIAGFSVKAALVPFHTWLPDAHSQAPSGISAMLSGIVIEAGLFAMMKTLFALYGVKADIGLVLIILAIISMFVGNIMALAQNNIKRMLAYSSIAQMGYIVLGIGLGFKYLVPLGFAGGMFHIITHAGMKGLAFLVAGIVIHYAGTANIDEMDGLAKKMPVAAFAFALAALALAGVPPLSGFMSKWMIYAAGIQVKGLGYLFSGIAIFNSVLSLGYYLPVVSRFYSGNPSPKVLAAAKVPFSVLVPVVLLAISVVALGIFPGLALGLVDNAARNIFFVLGAFKS